MLAVFGGVQFTMMFWGDTLPAPVDWVPLPVMSLTVRLFEAIFFRGFIQGRLEHSFGTVPSVVPPPSARSTTSATACRSAR
jgi:uncharacterized protein